MMHNNLNMNAKDLTINSLSTHLYKKKHSFSFLPFYVTERKRERNKEKEINKIEIFKSSSSQKIYLKT